MSTVRFLYHDSEYDTAERDFLERTCINSAAFFLSSSLSPGTCRLGPEAFSVLLGALVESMTVDWWGRRRNRTHDLQEVSLAYVMPVS